MTYYFYLICCLILNITYFMKHIIKLSLVLLTIIFVGASCSKDDSTTTPTPTPTPTPVDTSGKTSFKINGTLVVADETKATHYTHGVTGTKFIDIFAFKGGKQVLELHFPASASTFPAKMEFTNTSSWLTYQDTKNYHSTSGEMKVTTYDLTGNKIEGTFNFEGKDGTDVKTITEGKLFVNKITVQ